MTRLRVYVSGPYSNHGTASQEEIQANVRAAVEAGRELLAVGFSPFVPHLDFFWAAADDIDYETWIDLDMAWVEASQAVLRLPGESAGADREVERAIALGIPVFHDIESLVASGLQAGETILEEASRLVVRDRGQAYGLPEDDFARTAGMLNALFSTRLTEPFAPADVAKLMICVKLSRSMVSTRRDHWTDVAGYAATGHRCDFGEW